MTETETNQQQNEKSQKKPYTTPVLQNHGAVEVETQLQQVISQVTV